MNKKIVLATGNSGKLKEIQTILKETTLSIQPQSDFNVPEAIEDGLTFVENAIIKARNACKYTNLPAIADDSGIEVDFLKGKPGIHSSRYSDPDATNEKNNLKLLDALKQVEKQNRTARFQCVIVYMRHELDPTPIICQGTWEGYIAESTEGINGFGYDPLFYIPEHQCTSAQIKPELKNKISHRGQALEKLLRAITLHQNMI